MSEPAAGRLTGGRWPAVVLAVGFALLLAVGAITAGQVQSARTQNELVAHTIEVRAEATRLLTGLLDAETGQRGYLLTRKFPYRARYEEGARTAPDALGRLMQITTDNPRQQLRLRQIAPLVTAKLAELEQTAALTRAGKTDQALAIVRTDRGKLLMDRLRVLIAGVRAEENRLLQSRRAAVENSAQVLLLLSISGLVLAAALAAAALLAILRYARGIERANEDIRRFNEGLEATVAERTADLQAANDEIQRFAYIVSHDLRAPLVNVMGFTSELEVASGEARSLLEDAAQAAPAIATPERRIAIEEDLPEALRFIRASTSKMDRLINAILKLSREGRRTLAPETIDMTALVRGIGDALRQQFESAGAELTIAPLPGLVGDRLALDQIFGNLIENAVKYLSPGRAGRVKVTGRLRGDMVEYEVADNGRGIDRADLERVFDLFRRAGAQDRPGEGIGLAHVRALVRRLGGTITLESELNQGSRFTVTLPRILTREGAQGQ